MVMGHVYRCAMNYACFLAMFITITGCESHSSGSNHATDSLLAGTRHGLIAFVAATRNDPIFPILKAGAEQYHANTGGMEVRFLEPDGDGPQHQVYLLDSLDDPMLKGVCVQMNDTTTIVPALQRLKNRGVCVVSMLHPAPKEIRVGHAGFDDAAIGKALAQATVQVLGNEGTIMLLHAGIDHSCYGPRLWGFDEELRQSTNLTVLSRIDCQGKPGNARRIIQDKSARYPRLSLWVALDDWPLCTQESRTPALPSGFKLVTFSLAPHLWSFVRDGTCPALVTIDFKEIGGKALQFCEIALRNPGRNEDRYAAPVVILTNSNLAEYAGQGTRDGRSGPFDPTSLPFETTAGNSTTLPPG